LPEINDGGPAFPAEGGPDSGLHAYPGMSLRDYLAGQALSNPAVCSGAVLDSQLREWFGDTATNITRGQIFSAQAYDVADAMIARRARTRSTTSRQ
jgi:hypothetical protein